MLHVNWLQHSQSTSQCLRAASFRGGGNVRSIPLRATTHRLTVTTVRPRPWPSALPSPIGPISVTLPSRPSATASCSGRPSSLSDSSPCHVGVFSASSRSPSSTCMRLSSPSYPFSSLHYSLGQLGKPPSAAAFSAARSSSFSTSTSSPASSRSSAGTGPNRANPHSTQTSSAAGSSSRPPTAPAPAHQTSHHRSAQAQKSDPDLEHWLRPVRPPPSLPPWVDEVLAPGLTKRLLVPRALLALEPDWARYDPSPHLARLWQAQLAVLVPLLQRYLSSKYWMSVWRARSPTYWGGWAQWRQAQLALIYRVYSALPLRHLAFKRPHWGWIRWLMFGSAIAFFSLLIHGIAFNSIRLRNNALLKECKGARPTLHYILMNNLLKEVQASPVEASTLVTPQDLSLVDALLSNAQQQTDHRSFARNLLPLPTRIHLNGREWNVVRVHVGVHSDADSLLSTSTPAVNSQHGSSSSVSGANDIYKNLVELRHNIEQDATFVRYLFVPSAPPPAGVSVHECLWITTYPAENKIIVDEMNRGDSFCVSNGVMALSHVAKSASSPTAPSEEHRFAVDYACFAPLPDTDAQEDPVGQAMEQARADVVNARQAAVHDGQRHSEQQFDPARDLSLTPSLVYSSLVRLHEAYGREVFAGPLLSSSGIETVHRMANELGVVQHNYPDWFTPSTAPLLVSGPVPREAHWQRATEVSEQNSRWKPIAEHIRGSPYDPLTKVVMIYLCTHVKAYKDPPRSD